MSPDFGYFIGERHLAKLAHYPIGTLLICIPTGLVVLALFYLLRRDLVYILPAPHRTHLMFLAYRKPTWNAEFLFIAAVSILIGAWTHIVWDQFTHEDNFGFRHFAPLRVQLAQIGEFPITVAYLLQYISTIVGGGLLAWCYLKWLRSQPQKTDNESDSWRYLLLSGLATFSLAMGIALAIRLSAPVHEFKTFREFGYKMGVSAVSIFVILSVISALLCYRRKLSTANL